MTDAHLKDNKLRIGQFADPKSIVTTTLTGNLSFSPTLTAKIPIIGAHWGLGVSLLMVWVAELEPLNHWVGIKDQHWLHVVINGAVIYGAIPLKDAVVSMVGKGLRA